MAQPKRLPGISYNALAQYFVTTVTQDRVKAFDINTFGPFARDALVETAAKFGFEATAYVVMPDHAHFLVSALEDAADFERMVKAWKQKTGYEWSQQRRKLWQKGYWERVLRDDDNTLSVCRYIVENPVRAGLVSHATEYPLCGSTRYELDHILTAVQMKGWWRL